MVGAFSVDGCKDVCKRFQRALKTVILELIGGAILEDELKLGY